MRIKKQRDIRICKTQSIIIKIVISALNETMSNLIETHKNWKQNIHQMKTDIVNNVQAIYCSVYIQIL